MSQQKFVRNEIIDLKKQGLMVNEMLSNHEGKLQMLFELAQKQGANIDTTAWVARGSQTHISVVSNVMEQLIRMSFWQRLKWLLFGAWPVPPVMPTAGVSGPPEGAQAQP